MHRGSAERLGAGRRLRALELVLWVVAIGGAVILAHQRYVGAVTQLGPDFSTAYVGGARILAQGDNLYAESEGYVYSPLIALLLRPFAELDVMRQFQAWTLFMLACLVLSAYLSALRPGLTGWRRPLMFGFATMTTLHFWPVDIALFLGQADPLVLGALSAAVLAAARGRVVIAGVFLGLCGVIKSWPILFGLGMLSRPIQLRGLMAVAVTGLVGPGLALALGGPAWVADMVRATVDLAAQPLISHSIFGFADQMFGESGLAQPVVVSEFLQVAAKIGLLVILIGSLATLFLRGVDRECAIVHAAGGSILVLTVSHLPYAMFVLPLLWWWGSQFLRSPSVRTAAGACVLVAWWIVVSRSWPDIDSPSDLSAWRYSVVFLSNYAAVVLSCWLSLLVQPRHPGSSAHDAQGPSPAVAAM